MSNHGVSGNHKAHNSLIQNFQSGSIFESIQEPLESALLCLSQVGLHLQDRTADMSLHMQARFKAKTGILGTRPGREQGHQDHPQLHSEIGASLCYGRLAHNIKHDLDILFSFQPRLALVPYPPTSFSVFTMISFLTKAVNTF